MYLDQGQKYLSGTDGMGIVFLFLAEIDLERGIFNFTSEFFNHEESKEVFDAKSKNKIKKIN